MSRKFVYYGDGVAGANLLLDSYPATVAYSLRKLRTAYTGSAIRVRRSSDNAEQDISFDSNNELDTTTLLNFVGSGSCYVTIWYNQGYGGSIYDAVQTDTTRQPMIVNGGSVELTDGLPTISYNGTSHWLEIDNLAINQSGSLTDRSVFIVNKRGTNTDRIAMAFGNSGSGVQFQSLSRNNSSEKSTFRCDANIGLSLAGITTNVNQLVNSIWLDGGIGNPDEGYVYTDNALQDQGIQTFTDFTLNRGAIGALPRTTTAFLWDGGIQEIIYYEDNKIPDITTINTNINNYYNIY